MAGDIMMGYNMKSAAISRIENERVNFFGFVKSNVCMTEDLRKMAETFLDLLFECWTENYDQLCKVYDESEFRYQSFKWLKLYAIDCVRKGKVDPQKVKMTITAVCYLQGKEKAF